MTSVKRSSPVCIIVRNILLEDLISLLCVPLASRTGSEMPATPVRDVAWPELEGHEGPSSCHHNSGVWEGHTHLSLTNLPAALCSTGAARETCTKEGKENPVRLVKNS